MCLKQSSHFVSLLPLTATKFKLIKAGCDTNMTTHHNHFDNFHLSLLYSCWSWCSLYMASCPSSKASSSKLAVIWASLTHHTNFDDLHYWPFKFCPMSLVWYTRLGAHQSWLWSELVIQFTATLWASHLVDSVLFYIWILSINHQKCKNIGLAWSLNLMHLHAHTDNVQLCLGSLHLMLDSLFLSCKQFVHFNYTC